MYTLLLNIKCLYFYTLLLYFTIVFNSKKLFNLCVLIVIIFKLPTWII